MKYVEKPKVVEAEQWNGDPNHPFVRLLPGQVKVGWLSTTTGGCAVAIGDYIVKDAAGQYSALKPHVFQSLYEQVT